MYIYKEHVYLMTYIHIPVHMYLETCVRSTTHVTCPWICTNINIYMYTSTGTYMSAYMSTYILDTYILQHVHMGYIIKTYTI